MSTAHDPKRLVLLLGELAHAGAEVHPSDAEPQGWLLFAYIAAVADRVAEVARDLETAAWNRRAENTGEDS